MGVGEWGWLDFQMGSFIFEWRAPHGGIGFDGGFWKKNHSMGGGDTPLWENLSMDLDIDMGFFGETLGDLFNIRNFFMTFLETVQGSWEEKI